MYTKKWGALFCSPLISGKPAYQRSSSSHQIRLGDIATKTFISLLKSKKLSSTQTHLLASLSPTLSPNDKQTEHKQIFSEF